MSDVTVLRDAESGLLTQQLEYCPFAPHDLEFRILLSRTSLVTTVSTHTLSGARLYSGENLRLSCFQSVFIVCCVQYDMLYVNVLCT